MPTAAVSKPKRAAAPAAEWATESLDDYVYRIRLPFRHAGDTRSLLLISDIHWDSTHCDRKKLKRDLDEAMERDAAIIMVGDVFDVMQGKYDPRASKRDLRPELYEAGEYLDECVRQAAEWFRPYGKNLAFISHGNHEQSINKRAETCLLSRLRDALKPDAPRLVLAPDIWAFIVLDCYRPAGGQNSVASRVSRTLHVHHGYGGGGEVTRGLIDNSRTARQYKADFYLSGHIHRRNMDENYTLCVSHDMKLEMRRELYLRMASYKAEIGGWHASKGRGPRPIGGWWLSATLRRPGNGDEYEWRAEPT